MKIPAIPEKILNREQKRVIMIREKKERHARKYSIRARHVERVQRLDILENAMPGCILDTIRINFENSGYTWARSLEIVFQLALTEYKEKAYFDESQPNKNQFLLYNICNYIDSLWEQYNKPKESLDLPNDFQDYQP